MKHAPPYPVRCLLKQTIFEYVGKAWYNRAEVSRVKEQYNYMDMEYPRRRRKTKRDGFLEKGLQAAMLWRRSGK